MTEKRKVSELKANPLSLAIYGDKEDVLDLAESIGQHGLLSPIIIKPGGEILSGHRRYAAIMLLGWAEVDCIVYVPKDETDEEVFIIEANRSRQKTVRQLRIEGARLKILLGEAATQNRTMCLNHGTEMGGGPAQQIHVRKEVAKKLGISQGLWLRIDYINKHVEIGNETAIEAAALLDAGKITVSKAYNMIRKAVRALEDSESADSEQAPDTPEQTAHEFNVASKEVISQHIDAICEVLEKVAAMPDEDFSVMPWRLLAARVRMMNRYFAKLDERVARKRGRAFENMTKVEEVKDDGEDK